MSKTKITIVKLGGSVITKKKNPYTLNEKNINLLADQISRFYTQIQEKRSGNRVILVHGGGSFGHPIAKKYLIHKGFGAKSNKNKKNHTLLKNQDQILGASKTHRAMQNLNGAILTALLKRKVAAITLEPSSTFLKKENEILWQAQAQIS